MRHHIAVDLDGTLAHYETWKGYHHIGDPITPVLLRVKEAILRGIPVTIFTARAANPRAIRTIEEWCRTHLGCALPVTNVKLQVFTEFWDDRAISIVKNQGRVAHPGRSLYDDLLPTTGDG